MQFGEYDGPIVGQQALGASQHLRLRALDIHLDEPHRMRQRELVERDQRHLPRDVAGERGGAVAQQIRTARIERFGRERQRCRPRGGADRGAGKDDPSAKLPRHGTLQFGILTNGSNAYPAPMVRPSPPCAVKNPIGADVESDVARFGRSHPRRFGLVAAADDVEADHVVGEIDEQPDDAVAGGAP